MAEAPLCGELVFDPGLVSHNFQLETTGFVSKSTTFYSG
jgi:hypothetical protein